MGVLAASNPTLEQKGRDTPQCEGEDQTAVWREPLVQGGAP